MDCAGWASQNHQPQKNSEKHTPPVRRIMKNCLKRKRRLMRSIKKFIKALTARLWRNGARVATCRSRHSSSSTSCSGRIFDYYFFEVRRQSLGTRIVRDGLNRGFLKRAKVRLSIVVRRVASTHSSSSRARARRRIEAKDVGLAFMKEERVQTDRSIIVTAAEQIGHFQGALGRRLRSCADELPRRRLMYRTGSYDSLLAR